jgi:tripartite-type tricarboxylate transporter receptor subunit TctC
VKRLVACISALIACGLAHSQAYPTKAVRIIVPFQVVGASGTPARGLAELLPAALGQPVVVENRPGSNGVIGLDLCAKAAADGHTVCVTNASTISSNPFIYAKLPYDPPRDFAPIVQIGRTASAFLVHPSVPANSVQELFELAKAKPGSIAWPSSGFGSTPHLYVEYLKTIGIHFHHVPYKTIDQSTLAALSGEVQTLINSVGVIAAHVKAGKLRILASGDEGRSVFTPDVPSFREAGFGITMQNWVGAFAPAKTPREIVQRLNVEINRLLVDPRYRDTYLTKITQEPVGGTSEQFAEFLLADREMFAKLVKMAGIKPE